MIVEARRGAKHGTLEKHDPEMPKGQIRGRAQSPKKALFRFMHIEVNKFVGQALIFCKFLFK